MLSSSFGIILANIWTNAFSIYDIISPSAQAFGPHDNHRKGG